jgi:iron complex transport system ATP-binding protein
MSDEPVLELNNATVIRGGTRVIDGLSLTIRTGEHTAIVGPNGAGKSSLMKLLTAEHYALTVKDGAPPVRVFGQAHWNIFELRSGLGIVSADLHDRFAHGNLCGPITGLNAVVSGFFGSQGVFGHQHVSDDMWREARTALESIGGCDLAGKTLGQMSTGEVRRVLIARALVRKPRALVLDEPTRELDLVARHRFMERVRVIARQGTTILLVTHHIEEIIPEIDRVILLQRGRVACDGPKRSVLTSANLSQVFNAAIVLEQANGYSHVRLETTGNDALDRNDGKHEGVSRLA